MAVVFQKDKSKENVLVGKLKVLGEKIKDFKIPNSFYYFVILLAISVGFYLIMLIENHFTLAFGGDFSAQYIPMGFHIWDYYHDWIKTGHFTLFDPTIYLGVNSIGSNAYYGLFSPFNLIIVLLPRTAVPFSIALCCIIKLSCAGLFFSVYMSRAFNVKDTTARTCGIAYAFCGWCAFYLWYNNYQDILVFFPLVLLGVEKTIKEHKPWLLALGVFFLVICNYVLMVAYIVCGFLYAMFRFFQQIRTKTFKDNLLTLGYGFLGFAGGILLGFFVFMPAFMATMSSPKLESASYMGLLKEYLYNKDFKNFFNLIFSWDNIRDQHNYVFKERVYYPILEFFFPPTTCRSLPMLELSDWDFDDMAVSLWCYVPFIMFLVPALIQSGKEKHWSHFIGFALLVLSLFTPFMYFLTMGFTNGYARWTLFIVTSLVAYVGIYIDKIPNVAKWHIHVGYTFAVLGIIAAWVLSYTLLDHVIYSAAGDKLTAARTVIHRFADKKFDYTNIAFVIELAYVTVVYLALFFTYNKKAFQILTSVFVSIEAIAVGNFVAIGHGSDHHYNNGYAENNRFRALIQEVQKSDPSFYRVYASINDDYSVNNGFMNGYSTAGFFHSLYNYEVNDFTLWTGMRSGSKSVGGDYRGKYQDLDNLLGIKYYFISKEKSKYDLIEKNFPNGYIANVPFDFTLNEEYTSKTDEYLVYENNYLNDFANSYSSIYNNMYEDTSGTNKAGEHVKYSYLSSDYNVRNAMVLSTDAVLEKDDIEEVSTNYPDIVIKEKTDKASTSSLRYFYSTDYTCLYYDLSPIYKSEKIGSAKEYPFEKIPDIPNRFTNSIYDGGTEKKSKAMNWFAFYSSKVEGEPLFTAGTALYANTDFSGSIKYDFYFIDKDNKIFMYDCHDDNTTDNTADIRGFYITKDVYKMAVVGKFYKSWVTDISFSVESKDVYEARRDALRTDPVENVKYMDDKFTFDTNYERNLLVVSRVAYDKGWSIVAKNNDTGESFNVKVYKGNGGFVSFVAPKGHYSYTMTYQTPYLTGSLLVSAFSITTFFVSLLGYHLYQEKKRAHHLDKVFRQN